MSAVNKLGLISALIVSFFSAGAFAGTEPDWVPHNLFVTGSLLNGEPILRLPFPAGTVVLCQQGNCSPEDRSHSSRNCLHALDLSNASIAELPVVAAGDGTVVVTYTDAKPQDPNGGYGFGNYIKIDHGHGFFTMYAHLEKVIVKSGDKVSTGQQIGIMGNTGKTGNPHSKDSKHLHFSLHHEDPKIEGLKETVPMHAIIAADMDDSKEFKLLCSLEFVGDGASTKAHCYASENAPATPITLGSPNPSLAAKIKACPADVRLTVRDWDKHPKETHDVLKKELDTDPEDYEFWYWYAVTSLALKDYSVAQEGFEKIIAAAPAEPHWLRPWAYVQLGEVEKDTGKKDEALAAFNKALTCEPADAKAIAAAKEKIADLKKK